MATRNNSNEDDRGKANQEPILDSNMAEEGKEAKPTVGGDPELTSTAVQQPNLVDETSRAGDRAPSQEPAVDVSVPVRSSADATSITIPTEAILKLLPPELIVSHVLPYVGPGHYLFVSGISKDFKQYYEQYFAKLDKKTLPSLHVKGSHSYENSTLTSTFYGAVFSSVSCARYWDHDTSGSEDRLPDGEVCNLVVRHGKVQVLEWAHQTKEFPWDDTTFDKAAEYGHQSVLQYLLDNNCPWDDWTCAEAAGSGDLRTLKWLRANGCPWCGYTISLAADNGHLEIVQWAVESGCDLPDVDEWDADTFTRAAHRGWWDLIKYIHKLGCPWGKKSPVMAIFAGAGNLKMMKFAHEHGCPWGIETCDAAARSGNLECLKYAHENGSYPLGNEDYDDGEPVCIAAGRGDLEMLQYALEKGCRWTPEAAARAAASGQLGILDWALHENLKWDEDACVEAARGGNLDTLKWVLRKGCPYHEWSYNVAVKEGHLEILEWLRDNEYPCFYDGVIGVAVRYARMEIFEWVHEMDYPWDYQEILLEAAKRGRVDILEWLHQWLVDNGNEDQWNHQRIMITAAGHYKLKTLQWLSEMDHPWDQKEVLDIATRVGRGSEMATWASQFRQLSG